MTSTWAETESGLRWEHRFADFVAAMAFVNRVAQLAEEAQHHPDIEIRWNRVCLNLVTHDAGGVVTERDRELAAKISALLEDRPKNG